MSSNSELSQVNPTIFQFVKSPPGPLFITIIEVGIGFALTTLIRQQLQNSPYVHAMMNNFSSQTQTMGHYFSLVVQGSLVATSAHFLNQTLGISSPFTTVLASAAFVLLIKFAIDAVMSVNLKDHSRTLSDFEKRIEAAQIAVWGASYDESDNRRWSRIDPNYIGVGRSWEFPQVIQLKKNPLDADWEDELSGLWRSWGEMNKRFRSIYVDAGTLQHMSTQVRARLIESLKSHLMPGGFFWMVESVIKPMGGNMSYYSNRNRDEVAQLLMNQGFKLVATQPLEDNETSRDHKWEQWQSPKF